MPETGLFFKVLIFSKLPSIGMKGRWEKVWNMGEYLVELFHMADGGMGYIL